MLSGPRKLIACLLVVAAPAAATPLCDRYGSILSAPPRHRLGIELEQGDVVADIGAAEALLGYQLTDYQITALNQAHNLGYIGLADFRNNMAKGRLLRQVFTSAETRQLMASGIAGIKLAEVLPANVTVARNNTVQKRLDDFLKRNERGAKSFTHIVEIMAKNERPGSAHVQSHAAVGNFPVWSADLKDGKGGRGGLRLLFVESTPRPGPKKFCIVALEDTHGTRVSGYNLAAINEVFFAKDP